MNDLYALTQKYAEACAHYNQSHSVCMPSVADYNRCIDAMIDLLRAILDENGFQSTKIIL